VTDPISTDRLVLTPLRVEDADEMAAVLAADDLYTFIGGAAPTADQLRDRYGRQVTGGSEDERWHNCPDHEASNGVARRWTLDLRRPSTDAG
jgi:hypothetical protein